MLLDMFPSLTTNDPRNKDLANSILPCKSLLGDAASFISLSNLNDFFVTEFSVDAPLFSGCNP